MIALILLVVSLFFHTNVQMNLWFEDWAERADHTLSPQLLDELDEMKQQYPWYFISQTIPAHTHKAPSTTWSGSVEQWRPLVASHFTANKVNTAMCLLAAESKGNPDAKNPRSSAAGLFQFLRGTWNSVPTSVTGGSYDSGRVYNPEANIRSAAWLQNAAGWSQWSPYNRGLCRGL